MMKPSRRTRFCSTVERREGSRSGPLGANGRRVVWVYKTARTFVTCDLQADPEAPRRSCRTSLSGTRPARAKAEVFGGLGLGLFPAKSTADLHGGELTVESQPGRGARFTLSLPCQLHATEGSGPPLKPS